MMKNKKANKNVKNDRAKAFLNWSLVAVGGQIVKSDKGLPIWQNPKYPSAKEDLLVELAEEHGGTVELDMKVRISLNTPSTPIKASDIIVAGSKPLPFGSPAKKRKPAKKRVRKPAAEKTTPVKETKSEPADTSEHDRKIDASEEDLFK